MSSAGSKARASGCVVLRFCCRLTPTGRGGRTGQFRGGVFVPREDGGEYSSALRAGGVRQGAGTQAARHATDAEDSRRRVRGADHRLASGATAEGVRELEFAVAGAPRGRAGDCRVGEPRNAATDAKKKRDVPAKIAYWVIPPDADAEFAAHMEEVLETYARPLDCDCPVLCMDEQPVQLIRETRTPMLATRNRPRRVDYEYERAGTASVFMFCEPLSGWRQATARPRRTKSDWAEEVAGLLEGRYAACSQVVVVCDNLNTHTKGAFYERFEPQRARGAGSPHRVLLHTQARKLAEHRGMRVERHDPPVPQRSPSRRPRDSLQRNRRLVH